MTLFFRLNSPWWLVRGAREKMWRNVLTFKKALSRGPGERFCSVPPKSYTSTPTILNFEFWMLLWFLLAECWKFCASTTRQPHQPSQTDINLTSTYLGFFWIWLIFVQTNGFSTIPNRECNGTSRDWLLVTRRVVQKIWRPKDSDGLALLIPQNALHCCTWKSRDSNYTTIGINSPSLGFYLDRIFDSFEIIGSLTHDERNSASVQYLSSGADFSSSAPHTADHGGITWSIEP